MGAQRHTADVDTAVIIATLAQRRRPLLTKRPPALAAAAAARGSSLPLAAAGLRPCTAAAAAAAAAELTRQSTPAPAAAPAAAAAAPIGGAACRGGRPTYCWAGCCSAGAACSGGSGMGRQGWQVSSGRHLMDRTAWVRAHREATAMRTCSTAAAGQASPTLTCAAAAAAARPEGGRLCSEARAACCCSMMLLRCSLRVALGGLLGRAFRRSLLHTLSEGVWAAASSWSKDTRGCRRVLKRFPGERVELGKLDSGVARSWGLRGVLDGCPQRAQLRERGEPGGRRLRW